VSLYDGDSLNLGEPLGYTINGDNIYVAHKKRKIVNYDIDGNIIEYFDLNEIESLFRACIEFSV